jgi:hypothetical protein
MAAQERGDMLVFALDSVKPGGGAVAAGENK